MDDVRERRPSFLNCSVVQNKVRDVIFGDQRLTVRELAEKCWNSKTTLHDIVSKYSNMNHVCARRVLRLLTTENLEKRVELSRQFIKKITRDIFFLDSIVKTDEKLVLHVLLWVRNKTTVQALEKSELSSTKKARVTNPSKRICSFFLWTGRELFLHTQYQMAKH